MIKDIQGNPLYLSQNEPWPLKEASCELDAEGYCITCSDEALQARVLNVDEENGLARVMLNGTEEEIDISLMDIIAPGDIVLVHGGVAIARVGEESNA